MKRYWEIFSDWMRVSWHAWRPWVLLGNDPECEPVDSGDATAMERIFLETK